MCNKAMVAWGRGEDDWRMSSSVGGMLAVMEFAVIYTQDSDHVIQASTRLR
jgi:hypothetical protein